jgi:uncharacterized integral membrane protein
MSGFKLIFGLLILALFLLFIAQNAGYVDINLFHMAFRVPIFVILLVSFGIGFLMPSLYFSFREMSLRSRLSRMENVLKEFARGYYGKVEKLLPHGSPWNVLLVLSLAKQGKTDSLKGISAGPLSLAGEYLMRGEFLQEAKEKFQGALSTDSLDLNALKGMRDISFIEGDVDKALEYQSKVLDSSERWDREAQKAIRAELLGYKYLTTGEGAYVEEAFDLHKSPFVYYTYILYLLSQDRIKDAKKHMEKVFSLGYQEDVVWMLMEREEALAKVYDLLEAKRELIKPDTLAMVYMKLNLLSKAKGLEDTVSTPIRALLLSSQSHREQDKLCLMGIVELLKPFSCSCGKPYNKYQPMCDSCFKWGSIRRD